MGAPLSLMDFDYPLTDDKIAKTPQDVRRHSRLLCVDAQGGLQDARFDDLPNMLTERDLLVFNDTKVLKARLFGKKVTGGAVECLVERLLDVAHALCHLKASRAPKVDTRLDFEGYEARVLGRQGALFHLVFDAPILEVLAARGEVPIPPYFDRKANAQDAIWYQSIFAKDDKMRSVAAPTASLHFDDVLLETLRARGVGYAFVTLHVGAGTFMPVRGDNITTHIMHKESGHLPQDTANRIAETKAQGGRVIAVGTTVARVLETVYQAHKAPCEWAGETDIFIYPPYAFGMVDALITNFHLPKSTLLMLVSALSRTDYIKCAYAHALASGYRFFSYGDAMFIQTAAKDMS